MLRSTEQDGAVTFSVRVIPRASKSGIVGESDGALRVRIAAPPVDGAANEELIETLARALKVPRRDVEITTGFSSKLKHVRVAGANKRDLALLLTGNLK